MRALPIARIAVASVLRLMGNTEAASDICVRNAVAPLTTRQQACIVVAMDRENHIVSKTAGMGKVSAKQIDKSIGSQISGDAVLCTDSARNYAYFAKKKNLKHVSVNGSKKQYVAEKVYHIQHVNSYHSRLEDTINRVFKGVATKNLDKYLAWKNFLKSTEIWTRTR